MEEPPLKLFFGGVSIAGAVPNPQASLSMYVAPPLRYVIRDETEDDLYDFDTAKPRSSPMFVVTAASASASASASAPLGPAAPQSLGMARGSRVRGFGVGIADIPALS